MRLQHLDGAVKLGDDGLRAQCRDGALGARRKRKKQSVTAELMMTPLLCCVSSGSAIASAWRTLSMQYMSSRRM